MNWSCGGREVQKPASQGKVDENSSTTGAEQRVFTAILNNTVAAVVDWLATRESGRLLTSIVLSPQKHTQQWDLLFVVPTA
jgi:hypothetical protein